MSNATCWDCSSNHGLDLSDCQGQVRSLYSPQTALEIPSRSLHQRTAFSESLAPSTSPYVTPNEPFNMINPSYGSFYMPQDHTVASSTENGRRTGTGNYLTQALQYPFVAEDQNLKQNPGYSGQQQYPDGSYQYPSQPMQSSSFPTSSENTRHPRQYSPSYVPSSYLDNNRMPSIASPGHSSYPAFMTAVTRPSIVVDEAQDDPTWSQRDHQSSIYQDCLGTDISSASRCGASGGLDAQRSSTQTPSRNHGTRNDMMDASDLEEYNEGKLSVPRTPRRGRREDDSQPRKRHLTPEGREHAREVRRVQACKECRRRKIKVCLVWTSGFALLLTLLESQCKHVLERDLVSKPSSPGSQRDAFTFPCSFSSALSSRYPSPAIVESPLSQLAMNDSPYCQSPTPLPRAYTEPTYTDYYRRINSQNTTPY